MIIRHVQKSDKEFWFKLDKHLSENELDNKIRDKMGMFYWKTIHLLLY